MLVLTRAKDEAIMIGDSIEITVIEVRGDRVRLGIRAPKEVAIHRKEVYLTIRDANLEAARSDAEGVARLADLARRLTSPPPPGVQPPPDAPTLEPGDSRK